VQAAPSGPVPGHAAGSVAGSACEAGARPGGGLISRSWPKAPQLPRRYVLRPTKTKSLPRRLCAGAERRSSAAVVFAPDGPTLVVAGAGSGKTRTLVYRVSALIEDGVDPASMMLVTFTNRAAREMKRRVEALIGADLARAAAGTFHAVAARLLRAHAELIGYRPNFSILDTEDARDLLESATSDLGIPCRRSPLPEGRPAPRHRLVLRQHGTKSWTTSSRPTTPLPPQLEPIRAVVRRYLERKVAANGMDYDDLLLNWKRLMTERPEIRRALGARFRHVLVDEYQDVNRLQADLVDLLAADAASKNVMVVGDDAQSIYSFRGADFESLLTFPTGIPGRPSSSWKTNYRSTPEILRLADASIAHNTRRFEKTLHPVRGPGVPVAVVGTRGRLPAGGVQALSPHVRCSPPLSLPRQTERDALTETRFVRTGALHPIPVPARSLCRCSCDAGDTVATAFV